MIPEYALNAEDVRAMMLNTMESHLSLKTEGYRCTTEQTFNLLLKALADVMIGSKFPKRIGSKIPRL